jgi:hypothetical protein
MAEAMVEGDVSIVVGDVGAGVGIFRNGQSLGPTTTGKLDCPVAPGEAVTLRFESYPALDGRWRVNLTVVDPDGHDAYRVSIGGLTRTGAAIAWSDELTLVGRER